MHSNSISDTGLIDALIDPTFLVDSDWRFLHLNEPALVVAKRPLQELIGLTVWELYPVLIGTAFEELYRSVKEDRRARSAEIQTASDTWYHVSASPIGDGLLIQYRDVSDLSRRKATEHALRESELALQAAFKASPLAIQTLDVSGNVRMWNPAAEAMFGWKADEVIGQNDPTTPGDFADEHRALFAAEVEGHEVSGLETKRVRKDGTLIDVSVSSAPLRDAFGEIRGVLSVISDVTERKRLEQQLLQAQKMDAVGRLAGGVAHDFNNLLTAIHAYSDLLLTSLDDRDPRTAEVQEIRQAAQRGAGLTRQLLSFSRKQVVQPQVVTTDAVVSSLASLMRRLIGEDIELVLKTSSEEGCVKVDPGQLEQAVVNLVVNARDAMPNGGRVTLETSCVNIQTPLIHPHGFVRPGAWVVISVADTGCGITNDVMSHLFEPFFTTKAPGKGTGLGLSTVYGIVKQSGGHVLVESAPNRGSVFRLYFPRIQENPSTAAAGARPGATPGGAETLLLVEDEEAVRRPLRRILESAGYRVLCANNGTDALRVAAECDGRIDLLVTDLIMPHMGGRDLVERLTTMRRGIKALYISGYTGDAVRDRSALGPHPYLQKPFTTAGILSKVREVLDN